MPRAEQARDRSLESLLGRDKNFFSSLNVQTLSGIKPNLILNRKTKFFLGV
jgi:hypothetical protein